ncbi:MAG: hypothetical protein GQ570_09780 [Helicobacteraceae bacterium]|nr:hypothetical protein [Helicobacteraceae bacterium]
MTKYTENGFAKISNLFSFDELKPIRDTISRIVYFQAKKSKLEYCLNGLSEEQYPHEGLIRITKEDKEASRQIIDKIMVNSLVFNFTVQKKLLEVIKTYLHAEDIKDICFTNFHVRVDLPHEFKKEEEIFSLPWHQESNYFHKNVAKLSSIVVWVPLYECKESDGCLEVIPGSHLLNEVKHSEKYMLPEQKKHLRTYIEDKYIDKSKSTFAEANEGDVYINHFNLIHKSGINVNNKVRYTLLIRASNTNADDFII